MVIKQNNNWILKDAPAEEGLHYCICTAQVVDADGDVIDVNGVTLAPDVPLVAAHKYSSPDGKPTVIGTVVKVSASTMQVEGKEVPILVAAFRWASTELAQEYATLYDEGCMKSFSCGWEYLEATPNKTSGLDVAKARLMELSCVTLPANELARFLKARKDAAVELDDVLDLCRQMGKALKECHETIKACHETVKSCHEEQKACHKKTQDCLEEMGDRMDLMEAKMAVEEITPKADPEEQQIKAKLDDILQRMEFAH